jgi:transposase
MQIYLGIDWSSNKHDLVYLNEQGGLLARQTIAHSAEGFLAFDAQRIQLGIKPEECLIGIETKHNLFLDYLSTHHYEHIYIVSPHIVDESRGRYGAARAKTDQSDARLLADLVRTDRARLLAWQPNRSLTQQMAALVSLEHFLTINIVRLTNRLRQVLWQYYPQATQVFNHLDSPIALEFIRAYPSPDAAAQLSFEDFQSFARAHRYPNPKHLPACFARLHGAAPEATADTVQAFQLTAERMAELTLPMVRARKQTTQEILVLFKQHPDAPIFASLPGAGDKLAPALLVKFGDDRKRYPTPTALQAVAGTCPVTRRSGKSQSILFRRACDHEFREVVQQWARSSLDASVWANGYFHNILPHCRSVSHAYRCLGNRWLEIAWRLWQDGVPYDQQRHLQEHAKHVHLK